VPAGRLFLAFLRLGLIAFGGPAMVVYIRDLAVKKKQWLSQETFEDGTALCQSIPGATARQTAAYVGLRAGGPLGALAAFMGFGLPAFALMVGLSAAYQAGRDLGPVLAVFHGLHVIVIAIIANAAINFGPSSVKNWRDAILAAGAAVFLVFHGSPIIAIVASAVLSLLLYRGVNLPAKTAHTAATHGRRLAARVQAGDYQAFEEPVSRHERRLYTLAWHLTHNHHDAEDVAQNAFLSAMEHLADFRGESAFSTWITRRAVNHVLKLLGARRQRPAVSLEEPDGDGKVLPLPQYIATCMRRQP
jgi:chromate transport protein ChrA